MIEFGFTFTSVSAEATTPNKIMAPIKNITMLDRMIPTTVASVNLRKSFMRVYI